MKHTVSIILLVAIALAEPSRRNQEGSKSSRRSERKRELLEGNYGQRIRPIDNGVQYTEEYSRSRQQKNIQSQEYGPPRTPHREYGVPKVSDVLTAQGRALPAAAAASHLYSPVSAYQPRFRFEISKPVPSQILYTEHKIINDNFLSNHGLGSLPLLQPPLITVTKHENYETQESLDNRNQKYHPSPSLLNAQRFVNQGESYEKQEHVVQNFESQKTYKNSESNGQSNIAADQEQRRQQENLRNLQNFEFVKEAQINIQPQTVLTYNELQPPRVDLLHPFLPRVLPYNHPSQAIYSHQLIQPIYPTEIQGFPPNFFQQLNQLGNQLTVKIETIEHADNEQANEEEEKKDNEKEILEDVNQYPQRTDEQTSVIQAEVTSISPIPSPQPQAVNYSRFSLGLPPPSNEIQLPIYAPLSSPTPPPQFQPLPQPQPPQLFVTEFSPQIIQQSTPRAILQPILQPIPQQIQPQLRPVQPQLQLFQQTTPQPTLQPLLQPVQPELQPGQPHLQIIQQTTPQPTLQPLLQPVQPELQSSQPQLQIIQQTIPQPTLQPLLQPVQPQLQPNQPQLQIIQQTTPQPILQPLLQPVQPQLQPDQPQLQIIQQTTPQPTLQPQLQTNQLQLQPLQPQQRQRFPSQVQIFQQTTPQPTVQLPLQPIQPQLQPLQPQLQIIEQTTLQPTFQPQLQSISGQLQPIMTLRPLFQPLPPQPTEQPATSVAPPQILFTVANQPRTRGLIRFRKRPTPLPLLQKQQTLTTRFRNNPTLMTSSQSQQTLSTQEPLFSSTPSVVTTLNSQPLFTSQELNNLSDDISTVATSIFPRSTTESSSKQTESSTTPASVSIVPKFVSTLSTRSTLPPSSSLLPSTTTPLTLPPQPATETSLPTSQSSQQTLSTRNTDSQPLSTLPPLPSSESQPIELLPEPQILPTLQPGQVLTSREPLPTLQTFSETPQLLSLQRVQITPQPVIPGIRAIPVQRYDIPPAQPIQLQELNPQQPIQLQQINQQPVPVQIFEIKPLSGQIPLQVTPSPPPFEIRFATQLHLDQQQQQQSQLQQQPQLQLQQQQAQLQPQSQLQEQTQLQQQSQLQQAQLQKYQLQQSQLQQQSQTNQQSQLKQQSQTQKSETQSQSEKTQDNVVNPSKDDKEARIIHAQELLYQLYSPFLQQPVYPQAQEVLIQPPQFKAPLAIPSPYPTPLQATPAFSTQYFGRYAQDIFGGQPFPHYKKK